MHMANKLVGDNLVRRGAGRPKGSQNKVSKEAKAFIAEVADGLGGPKRMLEWAKESPENEKAFWVSIYPKLVSVTVAGDKESPLVIEVTVGGHDDG